MEGEVEGDPAPALEALPDAVRQRVLSLTAEVLPDLVRLPVALRRVASFAPPRRARLGATAITASLADEEFRERVAIQAATRPGRSEGRENPVDDAARAWLLRPEGWAGALDDAVRRLEERPQDAGRDRERADRLAHRLAEAEESLRTVRTGHRQQLQELKAENTSLRRKLGESRRVARAAQDGGEESVRSAEEARASLEARVATQDKELRRLRGQLEEREASAAGERRAARSERDEATMRARLLLDTVIEASSGLRRELGLPVTPGAPGDRVEADLAAPGERNPSSAGALGVASPTLLEQYLTMPRARLIVDGYNVSKTRWPDSSLEAQRIRLLNGLAPVVARTGVETTVVFDAAASTARPVVSSPRGVKVFFSPEGVIADDVIRDLVEAEPTGRVVVVVTNDREVVLDVVRAGARHAASEALLGLLARAT